MGNAQCSRCDYLTLGRCRVACLTSLAFSLATLAVTGARPQAVELLTQAIALKSEWLDSETHPGLLVELCDLHDVLGDAEAVTEVAGAFTQGTPV